jgi:hypothetical protein
MKTRLLILILAAGLFSLPAGAAETAECQASFYKTKDMECVKALIASTDKLPDAKMPNAVSPIIGFLAGVFANYPEEKARILAQDSSKRMKTIYLPALFRAGLVDDAKAYATKIGWLEGFEKYQQDKTVPLAEIKPSTFPGDNDMLIGAYMASGNTAYIKNILANFGSAKDGMVADSLRMSFMQGAFGPTLAPKDRPTIMVATACEKYECKKDMHELMRIMTLSSAFWALQSLARQDEGVKKAFTDYMEGDARLKRIVLTEANAFNNYRTMLMAYAAIKDNEQITSALSSYEKLGPPMSPPVIKGPGIKTYTYEKGKLAPVK